MHKNIKSNQEYRIRPGYIELQDFRTHHGQLPIFDHVMKDELE